MSAALIFRLQANISQEAALLRPAAADREALHQQVLLPLDRHHRPLQAVPAELAVVLPLPLQGPLPLLLRLHLLRTTLAQLATPWVTPSQSAIAPQMYESLLTHHLQE